MRSLAGCLLAALALRLDATTITQTSTLAVTPISGPIVCNGTSNCSSADPQGFTAANATATARPGYVSVELNGGATLYGAFASASSRASNSETYLFTNGTGAGTFIYSVVLMGFARGNPAESAAVLFNGQSYSVLPNAAPTYYSFTQSFTYGQPFLLTLSVEMASNWDGARADSGSRFASAQLAGVQVLDPFSIGGAAVVSDVPEPTTAMMWIGGALLILFGIRRKPKRR